MKGSAQKLKVQLHVVITVVLAGCVLAFAGTAAAGSGATVHQFSVTYPGDLATCSGNRIEKTGQNAFIKDVETCVDVKIDVGLPAGTYSAADLGWCSDYNAVIFDEAACNLAISGHVTIGVNGDGTFTWDVVAYYAHS